MDRKKKLLMLRNSFKRRLEARGVIGAAASPFETRAARAPQGET
jgi:hypothetical protein